MRTRKRKQHQIGEPNSLQAANPSNPLSIRSSHLKSSTATTTTAASTTTVMMGQQRNELRKRARMLALAVVVYLSVAPSNSNSGSGRHFLVSSAAPSSGLKFSAQTNAYSGLTFTFDPRLDKRVEWLHFEHWLSIMHQSSELLHETLNGRAHLSEIRVLIPYKWRNIQWPLLNKPGAPIIMNRRLRYSDSDVIVGFDDPTYKETPFAVQHDECAKQGLHISMPISFLEQDNNQRQSDDARLKARLLVREFASHRYGLFKESGFRNDLMYPPFASLAGLGLSAQPGGGGTKQRWMLNRTMLSGENHANHSTTDGTRPALEESASYSLRGFDGEWHECQFDTQPQNGLPTSQSAACLPYLSRAANSHSSSSSAADKSSAGQSFNLMSADPFSHADLSARFAGHQQRPVEWRDLADQAKWHFCGNNFAAAGQRSSSDEPTIGAHNRAQESYAHNQLANNKQNILCHERSAMQIIKASDDFRRPTFSPSTFNRLPVPNFSFLQEMPPRIILCVEYAAHLFQWRRLDHGILDAAIGKFLALDLMADSEIALVLFGQMNSSRQSFERLDSNIKSRLTVFNPAIDPFLEPLVYYTRQELAQLFASHPSPATRQDQQNQNQNQNHNHTNTMIVKGTCSFAKLMREVAALQQQRRHQYDDIGADILIISSGLFIESLAEIEAIIRAQFKPDSHQINLIIFPSSMLFNTKSNGSVVLDSLESEAVVRNRLDKLLLIQRLTQANIHLVKEHLDSNGDVKMSTLLQFYQVFDHISKGHSWDQQQSMMLLAHESVAATQVAPDEPNRFQFQFQVDATIQNELIVAFVEPRLTQMAWDQLLNQGKRFPIRNLQLRLPNGQLLLSDSQPRPMVSQQQSTASSQHHYGLGANGDAELESSMELAPPSSTQPDDQQQQQQHQQQQQQQQPLESALFPFRTQLGLAGFHLKAAHLAQLISNNSASKISGTWTLSAEMDDQLQTNGVAMARVNPAGDTLISNCWIQTYYDTNEDEPNGFETPGESAGADQANQRERPTLRSVKVFAQTRGPAGAGPIQELQARLEVQDEMGNIVQNVNMLDDGLGAPDITRGDGIHSQLVQRAHRPGFYKATVELTGTAKYQPAAKPGKVATIGQDNTCCGSSVPQGPASESVKHVARQLYCGTFFVAPEDSNRLGQQRPARVNHLSVVNVDQELRQVTLRWSEPASDLMQSLGGASHHIRFARAARKRSSQLGDDDEGAGDLDDGPELDPLARAHQSASLAKQHQHQRQHQPTEPGNRYEIKLFSDRDILKRSFEAKQQLEVGYKFSELNVVGDSFGNASSHYGGTKELTLRLPNAREGIYYIAMRVYNQLGLGSQVSNIVQFWLRSNMTELEELESIYGQPVTLDASGNVYDKNGELIGQRASDGFGAFSSSSSSSSSNGGGSNGLLRGSATGSLDGISVLLFISACGFLSLIVCVSLFACLVSSARRSLATKQNPTDDKDNRHSHSHNHKDGSTRSKRRDSVKRGSGGSSAAILAAGAGGSSSSMVSSTSQCEASSGQGDSLGTGSLGDGSHLDDTQKVALGGPAEQHLSYSQLRHQHHLQQQQADQIKSAYLQHQQQQHLSQSQVANNSWHTIVNGYAYATVAASPHNQQQQQQFCHDDLPGDLNQNGLGTVSNSSGQPPVWQTDNLMLSSHYDQLKARELGSPVSPAHRQRVELVDGTSGLQKLMNGLPQVPDEYEQSYLIRSPQSQQKLPDYYNQQLQQQLSSVLKSKQQRTKQFEAASSPALEGVAQEGHESANFQDALYLGAQQQPPPPAQYIYQCAEANIMHQTATDPTIYSQATGLQQVLRGSLLSGPGANTDTGYYANSGAHVHQQYSAGPTSGAASIYGPASNQGYGQQLAAPDEGCLDESYDKPNSAISEV